ncbi:MAG: Lrp/AsnC family transcriptional regulator [Paracoccaceae bacterium]|jgi:Lrp/AsnC family transcriptional regulator|nr:Lrp/AsnC family transcriptional regulator [Paracoccaceae bacterium]
MADSIDQTDRRLLQALQERPGLTQRDLAERIGLSQNACWRRLKRLEERGVLTGAQTVIDRHALGLDLVVFTMIRTRHHSADWLTRFHRHVVAIPEVIDVFRIAGDYDYMLKIVTADMASFDRVYRSLIELDLETVTSFFAMEAIAENRPLPVMR